jgi:Tol biopolymer transport system component
MKFSGGTTARALVIFTTRAFVGCGIEHRNVSFDVRPDGTAVVFSSADGDLYLFHLDSRSVERLTQTAREESTPAFSPDGQRVAYAAEVSGGGKSLFEYSLTTKATRQLSFDKGVNDLDPKYSPGQNGTLLRLQPKRPSRPRVVRVENQRRRRRARTSRH